MYMTLLLEGHGNRQVVRDQFGELESKNTLRLLNSLNFSFPNYLTPHALQKVL